MTMTIKQCPFKNCTFQIIPFPNIMEFKIIGFLNAPFPWIQRTFQIIGFLEYFFKSGPTLEMSLTGLNLKLSINSATQSSSCLGTIFQHLLITFTFIALSDSAATNPILFKDILGALLFRLLACLIFLFSSSIITMHCKYWRNIFVFLKDFFYFLFLSFFLFPQRLYFVQV